MSNLYKNLKKYNMITLGAMHLHFRRFMEANGYDFSKWTVDEWIDYSMTLDNTE